MAKQQPQHAASSAIQASKTSLPIIKMGEMVDDDAELRERLKSQWEYVIITAAFMAAVSVTFLAVDEPENNRYQSLWKAFLTLNAVGFLLLLVAVVCLTCFLTTLMMCPPGKVDQALWKLRYVEPVPSIALVLAIVLLTSTVPIYMILRLGHDTSTLVISIATGVFGTFGVGLFAWTTINIQNKLLMEDDDDNTNNSARP